jgi:hypothetical protein
VEDAIWKVPVLSLKNGSSGCKKRKPKYRGWVVGGMYVGKESMNIPDERN